MSERSSSPDSASLRRGARDRIASLATTFDEQDAGLRTRDPLRFEGYTAQLDEARTQTDLEEACVWGVAEIGGTRCALVVFDFAFLGGSMGMVAGEKVARAFDTARKARLPVVTVTASGGARMQEGMWSLVQMAKTVEARREHARAGLAHVSLLTSPTTGGVYASFASLADVVYAEAGATLGFAGPRVIEELPGTKPPSDVHTAEFAYDHGLVDAIVPVPGGEQPAAIERALAALSQKRSDAGRSRERFDTGEGDTGTGGAWERVRRVRDAAWPKAREIVEVLLDDAIELRGDRTGAPDDTAVVVRIGGVRGTELNAVVIGQDASGDGRIRPQGFRKAVRALRIAGRLGLPVVTIVDTRGADPLPVSEVGGVAAAIAECFQAMLDCPSPTLSVVTGEGGSGGALALAAGDRVLAVESAVFSVIAPEAAAAILHRDASRGADLAERLGITSPDLVRLGMVDRVVPDPVRGVSGTPLFTMDALASGVADELDALVSVAQRRRLRQRSRRWRTIARPVTGRRRDLSRGGGGGRGNE